MNRSSAAMDLPAVSTPIDRNGCGEKQSARPDSERESLLRPLSNYSTELEMAEFPPQPLWVGTSDILSAYREKNPLAFPGEGT